jgi:CPA1 family monovalent cation:H+ antiporter
MLRARRHRVAYRCGRHGGATQRLPVPTQVTNILNGESLINDASASSRSSSPCAAAATGAFSSRRGRRAVRRARRRRQSRGPRRRGVDGQGGQARCGASCRKSRRARDPVAAHALRAYLLAEALHVSGILAVVAAGLYMGSQDNRDTSVATRRHVGEVWTIVLYAFNGFVFLLLGLEIPEVMRRMSGNAVAGARSGTRSPCGSPSTSCASRGCIPARTCGSLFCARCASAKAFPTSRGVHRGLGGLARLRHHGGGAVDSARRSRNGTPFPDAISSIFLAATTILLTLVDQRTHAAAVHPMARACTATASRSARSARRASRWRKREASRCATRCRGCRGRKKIALASRLAGNYERLLLRLSANAARRADLDALASIERSLVIRALEAERASCSRCATAASSTTRRCARSKRRSTTPKHRSVRLTRHAQ